MAIQSGQPDTLPTLGQVADAYRVTERTVARWDMEGRIQSVSLPSGCRRFSSLMLPALPGRRVDDSPAPPDAPRPELQELCAICRAPAVRDEDGHIFQWVTVIVATGTPPHLHRTVGGETARPPA